MATGMTFYLKDIHASAKELTPEQQQAIGQELLNEREEVEKNTKDLIVNSRLYPICVTTFSFADEFIRAKVGNGNGHKKIYLPMYDGRRFVHNVEHYKEREEIFRTALSPYKPKEELINNALRADPRARSGFFDILKSILLDKFVIYSPRQLLEIDLGYGPYHEANFKAFKIKPLEDFKRLELSVDEEQELMKRFEVINSKKQELESALVHSHLRLAYKRAGQFKKYTEIEFEDLIQLANHGLIMTARYYDWRKASFKTYAYQWMDGFLIRAMCQSEMIKTNEHYRRVSKKIKSVYKNAAHEERQEPTIEQIAQELEIPPEKVRDIMLLDPKIISYDSFNCNPNDHSHHQEDSDFVLENNLLADNSNLKELRARKIKELLDKAKEDRVIKPKEYDVIVRRFELDENKGETLQEIGNSYDRTRERIRQVEEKALRKLRRWGRFKILECY